MKITKQQLRRIRQQKDFHRRILNIELYDDDYCNWVFQISVHKYSRFQFNEVCTLGKYVLRACILVCVCFFAELCNWKFSKIVEHAQKLWVCACVRSSAYSPSKLNFGKVLFSILRCIHRILPSLSISLLLCTVIPAKCSTVLILLCHTTNQTLYTLRNAVNFWSLQLLSLLLLLLSPT